MIQSDEFVARGFYDYFLVWTIGWLLTIFILLIIIVWFVIIMLIFFKILWIYCIILSKLFNNFLKFLHRSKEITKPNQPIHNFIQKSIFSSFSFNSIYNPSIQTNTNIINKQFTKTSCCTFYLYLIFNIIYFALLWSLYYNIPYIIFTCTGCHELENKWGKGTEVFIR